MVAKFSAKLLVMVIPSACLIVLAAGVMASSAVACGESSNDGSPNSCQPDVGRDVARDAPLDVPQDVPQILAEADVPTLESLTVTSAVDDPEIVLTPAFSPDTFDYYVRCAAGSNPLTVTAEASKGATVAIDLSASAFGQSLTPETSGFAASQRLSPLAVNGGRAVVAIAQNGSTTSQYWVRCLPSDMPTWTWQAHPENGALPASYFLVGDLYPTQTAYALVLDENGVPVWYEPATPTGYGAGDVDSTAQNSVSFLNFFNVGIGPFTIFDLSSWTTTVLPTSSVWSNEQVNLHELKYYPKTGNYLVLGQPYTYGVDLSGLPLGGTTMVGGPNSTISDCAVLEIKPSDGTIVNSWLASQHFDTEQVTTMPYGAGGPDGGLAVDVYHCNSIDIDPVTNDLLISMRNANTVVYITWPEGEVLWKMGGINQSNNNAPFVAVDSPFAGQHDVRLHNWNQSCNGGAGQVSMFDDETGGTLSTARGVIYDVVVGTGGSTCACTGTPGTATVSWQYPSLGTAGFSGSVRPLTGSKDALWVIGWGEGTSPYVFSVIDQITNKDLLDFAYTDGEPESSYRAIPVPLGNLSLTALRETAGLPIP
jgi:hypothetical protein